MKRELDDFFSNNEYFLKCNFIYRDIFISFIYGLGFVYFYFHFMHCFLGCCVLYLTFKISSSSGIKYSLRN